MEMNDEITFHKIDFEFEGFPQYFTNYPFIFMFYTIYSYNYIFHSVFYSLRSFLLFILLLSRYSFLSVFMTVSFIFLAVS